MTKEEWEQYKADQHSDDPLVRMQAQIVMQMFPDWDNPKKVKFDEEGVGGIEAIIRSVLNDYEVEK